MNRFEHAYSSRKGLTVAAAAVLLTTLVSVHATDAGPRKIVRQEGGLSPSPVLTSITAQSNKTVNLQWQSFGNQVPHGSNVVYKISKCPALKETNATWTTVATVTNATQLTTDLSGDAAFISVSQDPAPIYAGAEKCGLCHLDTHDSWMSTVHAGAFQTLKSAHMDKNASCLPCHTVGYGTPNGFVDEATTPQLAGVQCENCHGPAGAHASRPLDSNNKVDLTKLPVQTLSASMCGGCHSDIHHPTFEEWSSSVHGTTQIPAEEFADPTNGPPRMLTCGACHSAATRVALLNAVAENPNPATFSPDMPSTQEASTTGITCAACHNPHSNAVTDTQLRFPIASKIPYSYSTATNFAANFNPQVQTCGQCHNMRGATWTGTSRPPHHSPQYNFLIGSGGYEGGSTNVPQSAHMDIEDQCAQCHTHQHTPASVTADTPAYMGHDFNPTMQACAPCHDPVGAELIKDAVQGNIKQQIAEIKGLLDQWATTKAPDALKQKYGVLAWEYNVIGELSAPTTQNPTGPTATEQKTVPDAIKQARHNLYMVLHDGSYGVHNGNYTRFLLEVARNNVNGLLQAQ